MSLAFGFTGDHYRWAVMHLPRTIKSPTTGQVVNLPDHLGIVATDEEAHPHVGFYLSRADAENLMDALAECLGRNPAEKV